jgi:hypothetical protein
MVIQGKKMSVPLRKAQRTGSEVQRHKGTEFLPFAPLCLAFAPMNLSSYKKYSWLWQFFPKLSMHVSEKNN